MNNYIITEESRTIRALGYNSLRDNWWLAVGTILLSNMLVLIPALFIEIYMEGTSGFESFLLNLEALFIGAPLSLGVSIFCLALFRNGDSRTGIIFSGFEYILKAVLLRFVTGLFILLWSILLVVPGIIAAIKYSQAFYILADDPSKDIMQCIEESKWMMRGNKWKYFCLMLSFIGWAILAAIPAGLGYIWLLPYVYMTQTAFYELVSGNLKASDLEDNINE